MCSFGFRPAQSTSFVLRLRINVRFLGVFHGPGLLINSYSLTRSPFLQQLNVADAEYLPFAPYFDQHYVTRVRLLLARFRSSRAIAPISALVIWRRLPLSRRPQSAASQTRREGDRSHIFHRSRTRGPIACYDVNDPCIDLFVFGSRHQTLIYDLRMQLQIRRLIAYPVVQFVRNACRIDAAYLIIFILPP